MRKIALAALATVVAVTLSTGEASAKRRAQHHHHHRTAKIAKVAPVPLPRPRTPACLIERGVDLSPWRVAAIFFPLELAPAPFVPDSPETAARIAEARRHVVRTTLAEGPGGTMVRMGREIVARMPKAERARLSGADVVRIGVEANVAKLHPVFVMRLSLAIQAARAHPETCPERRRVGRKWVTVHRRCLAHVALFSGYRPPGFGIGGFGDKFQSSHAYGIGGDVRGIGRPGSKAARLWQKIAWDYRIYSPYGPTNRAEWNHVQATGIKMVLRAAPALRGTITRDGPVDLARMWEAAARVIDKGRNWTEAALRIAERPRARASRRPASRWGRHRPAKPPETPGFFAMAGT